MTYTWSRSTAEKSGAQAHTSVSGRQLQHALASAVAAAGATLSAQSGSWKLVPPLAPQSSPDPSLTGGMIRGAQFKASGLLTKVHVTTT